MKLNKLTAAALALVFFAASCSSDSGDSDLKDSTDALIQDNTEAPAMAISDEMVNKIIQAFPNPLEMTSLLKTSGAQFSEGYINDPGNLGRFINSYDKAFNLGAYGADLGYANFYEETGTAIQLLGSVRSLSNDLKVGQFFNFSSMQRLAKNRSNLDSLLYISTKGFQDMDEYLTSTGRPEVSMLMLYGGWLEGLYLASKVCKDSKDGKEVPKELSERIGEQKIIIDDLQTLLSSHKGFAALKSVSSDLDQLKAIYDQVTITTVYAEPTRKEVNGMLIVEDNSSSEVKMSAETLEAILDKVIELRNQRVTN